VRIDYRGNPNHRNYSVAAARSRIKRISGNGRSAGQEKERKAMLVLSRKINESIVIGDNIVITVVKVDRNTVRLGIEAPPEVKVFRKELLENIQDENVTMNSGVIPPDSTSNAR
jgi:carbon storage regulator CsrA